MKLLQALISLSVIDKNTDLKIQTIWVASDILSTVWLKMLVTPIENMMKIKTELIIIFYSN